METDVGSLLIISIATCLGVLIWSRRQDTSLLRIEELEERLTTHQSAVDLVQVHLLEKVESQRLRIQSLEVELRAVTASTRNGDDFSRY